MDIEQDLSATPLVLTVYVLQALSFFIGFTAVAGVIINYVKQEQVAGTWLASHFTWQIRTFWYGLLWFVIGSITTIILIGWLILLAVSVWVIYRIVAGWLNLSDHKPMNIK